MPPPDFWDAIGGLASAAAVPAVWKRDAGADFPLLAPFLADAGGSPPDRYPCADCGRWISLVEVRPGEYLAEHDDPLACATVLHGLKPADVQPVALDPPALRRAAATALTIEEPRTESVLRDGILQLGSLPYQAGRAEVYLAAARDPARLRRAAERHHAKAGGPVVLIGAAHDQGAADYLAARGSFFFAAPDLLRPMAGGRFARGPSLAEHIAARGAGQPLRTARAPLALVGKRFRIEEDFSEVMDAKTRRRHALPPGGRLALETLVNAGAKDAASGLTAKELCEAVWRRTQPREEWPRDYKPIQFFRARRDGRTKTLPLWGTLIRSVAGKVWLTV